MLQQTVGANCVAAPDLVCKRSLETLFARIGQISSLPHAASRIIRLANDAATQIDDLRHAIQEDPSLAARVLRRINSSYYGLRQPISDLKSAIGLLGFREIRNIALTVYVSRLFEQRGDVGSYSREGLWNHLVAVAAASRLVSLVCGRAVPDEAYVGGLLHDIGLILIDQHLRRHFCRVVQSLDSHTPTVTVEREILTFDHVQLGEFVARQWSFPEPAVAAIRYHHDPQEYQGPFADWVNVVAVANYLCSRSGFPSLGIHNVAPPPDEVFARLKLDQTDLRIIRDELSLTLEHACTVAQV